MAYVEGKVLEMNGRLLVVETSSKESYAGTVEFYRRLGYEETSRIRDFYDVGDDKIDFCEEAFLTRRRARTWNGWSSGRLICATA